MSVCNVCVRGSAPSRHLETGFLPGGGGLLSLHVPREASSRETSIGIVFVYNFTSPSQFLPSSCRLLGSKYGRDVGMLFQHSASVFIHLPAQHCVSLERTPHTPRTAALASDGRPRVALCYLPDDASRPPPPLGSSLLKISC